MNSGVNASLRFAFTTIVERGAFYNRKQVRKEEKEFVYQKVSNQRKGVYLSKGCLYYQRCQIKERVYMKKGKGGKEKQKENQNMSEEKGECYNKTNTKTIQNKTNTKTNYNKMNTNTNKRI